MANIFSDIFKFAGSVINQALTPDILRDQRHASKLFVSDQYARMPKYGFLFHVKFELNDVAYNDPQNPNKDREIGLLVKSVSLPKFSLDVKKYNAYNRPNFVQNKIAYDPIQITFHDDSSNIIRNFWFDYFNYYYRDSDYNESLYGIPHKYEKERPSNIWGFTPRSATAKPYLKAIRIYSLHQKKFSEYVLLNPIIKNFRHGDHQQGQSELLQHDMTIDYESVLYFYGSVTPSNVSGFADLHYDKMPSPLTPAGGGTKSILGPGGLFDTADDVIGDLKDGNYGAALFKGGKLLKTAKSMDLKRAAIGEVLEVGKGVLRGNNPQNNIFVPDLSGANGAAETSSASISAEGSTGVAKSGGWLAGAAVVGLGVFGKSKSNSAEVTDASVSRKDNPSPATPTDKLPAPDAATASPLLLAAGEDPKRPSTPLVINRAYAKGDITNQISAIKVNLQGLQKEQSEYNNQAQLAADAIDFLDYRRETLISEGKVAEAQEITKQIEQQNKIIINANTRSADLEEQINRNRNTLSLKQTELNSLS